MACKIQFYGRDFSKIDLDLDKTKVEGFDFELNTFYKTNLLLYFLNHIKSSVEPLVVNKKKNEIANETKELFSEFEGNYYFGGIVGVVSKTIDLYKSDIKGELGNDEENKEYKVEISLQIQSRFDIKEENGRKVIGKPFFLSTMLSGSNPILNNDFIPSNTEDYLFDYLLLFIFKAKLEEANVKGLYRTYHRFERNDDRVKGSIDVSRHIKENMGLNNGRIAYSYRENSVNNYLNHLIVTAYNYLKKKYFGMVNGLFDNNSPELKRLIDNLSLSIGYPKYDIKTTIMKNLNSISHPFYTEYEALRKICLKILRNEGISIFDGISSDKVEGILFYIPDLWERYLEGFLRDSQYTFSPQWKIKLIDYNNDNIFRQSTYPDYVFFNDRHFREPFMILDAKFKEKWSEIVLNKGAMSNALEDYDKAVRDMVSINAHATGVVFPTNDIRALNPREFISHNISEFNKTDKFLSFPIYVPYSSDNYREWSNNFRNNCKNIASIIKEYVVKEKQFMLSTKNLMIQMEALR